MSVDIFLIYFIIFRDSFWWTCCGSRHSTLSLSLSMSIYFVYVYFVISCTIKFVDLIWAPCCRRRPWSHSSGPLRCHRRPRPSRPWTCCSGVRSPGPWPGPPSSPSLPPPWATRRRAASRRTGSSSSQGPPRSCQTVSGQKKYVTRYLPIDFQHSEVDIFSKFVLYEHKVIKKKSVFREIFTIVKVSSLSKLFMHPQLL